MAAEVCIKRFCARNRQEHRAEHDNAIKTFIRQKLDRVPRVEGKENAEVVSNMNEACKAHDDEPDRGDRSEKFCHRAGAVGLDGEEANQDTDRDRNDEGVHLRGDELQAFHRRKH